MKRSRNDGGSGQQEESLLEFFRRSPLWGSGIGIDIDIERQDDFGREIDLPLAGPARPPGIRQSANPARRA